jgi:hypothetical protein
MKKIFTFLRNTIATLFDIPATLIITIGIIIFSIGAFIRSPKDIKLFFDQFMIIFKRK